jgi:hypothetical protein
MRYRRALEPDEHLLAAQDYADRLIAWQARMLEESARAKIAASEHDTGGLLSPKNTTLRSN